jgi:hypothetical protein
MSEELELATFTAEGIGRIMSPGVRWLGARFLRAGSTGNLAFLNEVVGIFEAEVDMDGNFSKTWELT